MAQVELARAVVGSGPNGGTEAPSRAKRRPCGLWRIANTSRDNTCLESVDGSVACAVSESCVVLRAGAGRLVVACGTSSRISETRGNKFRAQRAR
eukprot:11397687-Alexandrium_andersonii.AAC.1